MNLDQLSYIFWEVCILLSGSHRGQTRVPCSQNTGLVVSSLELRRQSLQLPGPCYWPVPILVPNSYDALSTSAPFSIVDMTTGACLVFFSLARFLLTPDMVNLSEVTGMVGTRCLPVLWGEVQTAQSCMWGPLMVHLSQWISFLFPAVKARSYLDICS